MKRIGKIIVKNVLVGALVLQFSILPSMAEVKVSNLALKLVNQEITANVNDYFSSEELSSKTALQDRELAFESLQELKKKAADSSYSLNAIKEEMNRQLILEEETKITEMKYLLMKMSSEKLDVIFEKAIAQGHYSNDFALEYQSSFTMAEKQEVVLRMIQDDLASLRSVTAKRLGILDRSGLLREFSNTESLLATNNKGRGTWKVVLVVVLSVAVAGLMTWGIISGTKARYERKTREMNADYDQRERDLQNQYASAEQELIKKFEERNRLREQGYAWNVCKTEEKQTTATCSYDHRTYTGKTVCVTYCLRNPTTGDEVQSTKTCSSGYVPNNCFVQNPYEHGYQDGDHDGRDAGYDDGYDAAYHDAYEQYYNDAYPEGYRKGYESGYNIGFSDGWDDAAYDDAAARAAAEESSGTKIKKSLKAKSSDEVALGFSKGYREGYAYAQELRLAY